METQLLHQGDRRPICLHYTRPRYTVQPVSRYRIARSELGYRKQNRGAIARFHNCLLTAESGSQAESIGISNPESDSDSELDSEPDAPWKTCKNLFPSS